MQCKIVAYSFSLEYDYKLANNNMKFLRASGGNGSLNFSEGVQNDTFFQPPFYTFSFYMILMPMHRQLSSPSSNSSPFRKGKKWCLFLFCVFEIHVRIKDVILKAIFFLFFSGNRRDLMWMLVLLSVVVATISLHHRNLLSLSSRLPSSITTSGSINIRAFVWLYLLFLEQEKYTS